MLCSPKKNTLPGAETFTIGKINIGLYKLNGDNSMISGYNNVMLPIDKQNIFIVHVT